MAQITLTSKEILPTLESVELLFPGVDLSLIKKLADWNITVDKFTMSPPLKDGPFTLTVSITKP